MAVIVFGSINTDIGLGVRHLPVPGETVLTGGHALVPGGKGCNQAVAAAKLGADVRIFGAVGDDAMAAIPLDAMESAGVDTSGVKVAERPTALAAVMVADDGENAIVVASGANLSVGAEQLPDSRAGDVLVCQMDVPFAENAAALGQGEAAGAVTGLSAAPFGGPNIARSSPMGCRQSGAYAVASRTPSQSAGGTGGRQRRAPTGGAAKGIFLQVEMLSC